MFSNIFSSFFYISCSVEFTVKYIKKSTKTDVYRRFCSRTA